MNKVVIISHDALTPLIKRHFFIEEMMKDGIEVEYWCTRTIVHYAKKIHYSNELNENFYTEIESLGQLKKLIDLQQKDTWFCVELWFTWDCLKIFKLLKSFNNQFRIDWYCNIPVTSLKHKIKAGIRKLKFGKLFRGVSRMISRKAFKVYTDAISLQQPSLFFAPGKKSMEIFNDRNTIALNHHDFESFQQSRKNESFNNIQNKYAVFLDVMLPFHPDLKRLGSKTIDPAVYFTKLNSFFDQLEQQLNLEVIIAAHPKSSYTNEFNNRRVLKGMTNELVEHSSVVLAHHSAAINYSILNEKKLVLIYSNEFQKTGADNYILQNIYDIMVLYGQYLNCSVINIDKKTSDLQFKEVDIDAYQKFLNDYIIGSQDESNYDVIKRKLFNGMQA